MLIAGVVDSGLAALLRALSAFLFLVISARVLSLESFGDLMLLYTVINVIGLVVDYGQQLSLLRSLSRDPQRHSEYIAQAMIGKAFLVLPAALMAIFFLFFYRVHGSGLVVAVLLFAAYIFQSFALFSLIPYRARSQYRPDLVLAALELVLLSIGLWLASEFNSSTLGIVLSLVVAKFLVLILGGVMLFHNIEWPSARVDVIAEFKNGLPFAAHLIVGTLLINVDLLIIADLVMAADYALYQGGVRLVQGAGVLLAVINNVFLPRWQRLTNRQLNRESRLMYLVGLIGLLLLPPLIHNWSGPLTQLIYGPQFLPLAPLLWVFSAIALLRMVGAFTGVILTTRGMQATRVWVGIVAVLFIVSLNLYFSPRYGISATAGILLVVHVLYLAALAAIGGISTRNA